ncbi:MAG: HAD family hydrolase [Oligoflexia bacterium]|nr:HAD family hydrolase [Oligoflexia bacterium]
MNLKPNKAVFLDRDGVINEGVIRGGKPYPPQTVAEFKLLPGVSEAVMALKKAGYKIIVTTNQPDVSQGKQKMEVIEAMHGLLKKWLPLDAIKVCFHVDSDNCECRKPKAGMIFEASKEFNIDLKKSFMIGDRWRDVEAGQTAGCTCFFLEYDYKEKKPAQPYIKVQSLLEAGQKIISGTF